MDQKELPMGLGMALAQNQDAMHYFSNLTNDQQQDIVNHTHQIQSRREMQQYVQSLAEHNHRF